MDQSIWNKAFFLNVFWNGDFEILCGVKRYDKSMSFSTHHIVWILVSRPQVSDESFGSSSITTFDWLGDKWLLIIDRILTEICKIFILDKKLSNPFRQRCFRQRIKNKHYFLLGDTSEKFFDYLSYWGGAFITCNMCTFA